MAVEATTAFSGPYITNGATVIFPFSFIAQSADEVGVVLRSASGVDTVAPPSLYSVALNNDGTGSVTFAVAPATGSSLYVFSDVSFEQTIQFEDGSSYKAAPVNEVSDRSAVRDIYLLDKVTRGITVPIGESLNDLPAAVVRAGKFMAFDASGHPVASSGTGADDGLRTDIAASTGSALSGFQQSGAGAIAETTETALRRIIFATQYGMSPAASAAVNLAALKNAVAATPAGGTLIVPEGTYTIDVTGGLSNAVNVNKSMTLQINGTLICNAFAIQTNPYYIFNVPAADVHMVGTGTLQGNGTINDANSGDTTTHPGLVYVSGDRFVFDLNVVNVPKVGIVLASCYDGRIGGRWKGGPTVYGSTGYFGIIATGGGRHIFDSARAERDALGGRFVNFIFTSNVAGNANDCIVWNCFADVWEKLVYANGNGHYVHDNDGFGFATDWIRFQGNDNRAYRNKCANSKGGVSAYDGKNIEICDNTFTNCRQVGVFVGRLNGSYTSGFAGLKISGNTLLGDSANPLLASGLHVLTEGSDTGGVLISNNRVENFGQNAGDALIKVSAITGTALSDVKIIGNKIGQTTKVGIALDQVLDSTIEGNTGASITQYFLAQSNSARLRWINNTGSNITSKGVSGLDSTSQATGNRFSNGAIEGTATLVAGTVTVNTAEILAGDRVSLTVQTPGGAQGHLSRGAIVAGTSFVINSSSATDTSTVYWRIEH